MSHAKFRKDLLVGALILGGIFLVTKYFSLGALGGKAGASINLPTGQDVIATIQGNLPSGQQPALDVDVGIATVQQSATSTDSKSPYDFGNGGAVPLTGSLPPAAL